MNLFKCVEPIMCRRIDRILMSSQPVALNEVTDRYASLAPDYNAMLIHLLILPQKQVSGK